MVLFQLNRKTNLLIGHYAINRLHLLMNRMSHGYIELEYIIVMRNDDDWIFRTNVRFSIKLSRTKERVADMAAIADIRP